MTQSHMYLLFELSKWQNICPNYKHCVRDMPRPTPLRILSRVILRPNQTFEQLLSLECDWCFSVRRFPSVVDSNSQHAILLIKMEYSFSKCLYSRPIGAWSTLLWLVWLRIVCRPANHFVGKIKLMIFILFVIYFSSANILIASRSINCKTQSVAW